MIPGTGQVLDSAGNVVSNMIVDSAGNYINGSFPGNDGPYITSHFGNLVLNYPRKNPDGTPTLDSGANQLYDSVTCSMTFYEFADITIDSTGKVTFSGPVIVQLVNMVQEIDNTQVDTCCAQIDQMISSINNSSYNFGTFSNYQELITEVNDYTTNLDSAKINLERCVF